MMNVNRKWVIFDIDNCISDDKHRHNHIENNPSDLDFYKYHQGAHNDKAKNVNIVKDYYDNDVFICFITSRPDEIGNSNSILFVRRNTIDWIESRFSFLKGTIGFSYNVFMRSSKDKERSPIVKRRIVKAICGLEKYNGAFIPPFSNKNDLFLSIDKCSAAHDDREDVLAAYSELGIPVHLLRINNYDSNEDSQKPSDVKIGFDGLQQTVSAEKYSLNIPKPSITPAGVLLGMISTFNSRNGEYRESYHIATKIIESFFPEGINSDIVSKEQFHLFILILIKAARFVQNDLAHKDSIHDIGVYSAMIESIIINGENENG